MKKSEIYKFRGEEITVKELSTSQVVGVLEELKDFQPHFLDVLMGDAFPLQVVLLATGLKEEDLVNEDVTPSEIEDLYGVVRKVNPTLAAMAKRLAETMKLQPMMS